MLYQVTIALQMPGEYSGRNTIATELRRSKRLDTHKLLLVTNTNNGTKNAHVHNLSMHQIGIEPQV